MEERSKKYPHSHAPTLRQTHACMHTCSRVRSHAHRKRRHARWHGRTQTRAKEPHERPNAGTASLLTHKTERMQGSKQCVNEAQHNAHAKVQRDAHRMIRCTEPARINAGALACDAHAKIRCDANQIIGRAEPARINAGALARIHVMRMQRFDVMQIGLFDELSVRGSGPVRT